MVALSVDATIIVQRGIYVFVTKFAFDSRDERPAFVPSEKKVYNIKDVNNSKAYVSTPSGLRGLKREENTTYKTVNMRSGLNNAHKYPKKDPW